MVSREGLSVLQGGSDPGRALRGCCPSQVPSALPALAREKSAACGETWFGCAGFPAAFGFGSSWGTGWKGGQSEEGVSGAGWVQ